MRSHTFHVDTADVLNAKAQAQIDTHTHRHTDTRMPGGITQTNPN